MQVFQCDQCKDVIGTVTKSHWPLAHNWQGRLRLLRPAFKLPGESKSKVELITLDNTHLCLPCRRGILVTLAGLIQGNPNLPYKEWKT